MGNSGRITMSLFVALLALVLVGTLTTIGWLVANPRGRVEGTLNSLEQNSLTLINSQRELLAVNLIDEGKIQHHLATRGLPLDNVILDYRGDTAVALHLSQQTIHDRPTSWPLAISLILTLTLLTLLFAPTLFESQPAPTYQSNPTE